MTHCFTKLTGHLPTKEVEGVLLSGLHERIGLGLVRKPAANEEAVRLQSDEIKPVNEVS